MTRALVQGGVTARNKPASRKGARGFSWNYFQQSESPLASLYFLLPFLALFEIGSYYHPSDLLAFHLLQGVFGKLGVSGRSVPALALIGILLAWHIARKERWSVKWETLACMALESALVAMPLLVLGVAFSRWRTHVPLGAGYPAWADDAVFYLGAGLYEELAFRLILMTILLIILADGMKIPQKYSYLLMVLTSAILFSLYHYLGRERFSVPSMIFQTAAGIYFGVLFLTRGFGITAGCHIYYDLIVMGWGAAACH